jgi:CBS domain-containing protein
MKVNEVMTRDVVTVPPTATLKQAAGLLVQHGISGLPVVDGGRLVGILSERDLLFKEQEPSDTPRWLAWLIDPLAVADQPKLDAHTVGEAMSSPALTIEAGSRVAAAAKRMLGSGISRLPVIEDGELVGIVTRADLVRAFVRSNEEIAREIHDDVIVRGLWLDSESVEIDVHDGEVTLSGSLQDHIDEELLPKLVAGIPGVVSVRMHMQVG